jgi:hypothetical protein
MDKQDLQEVQEVVKGLADDMKTSVTKDIRKQFDDELATKFEGWGVTVKEIKTQLAEMAINGTNAPTDEKVVSLEAKIAESEEKQLEMEEKIRLLQTRQTLVPEGGKKELDFGGVILKKSPELIKYMRTYWMGDYAQGVGSEERVLGSGLFATGGQLPADVADAFIDFVIEQQAALSIVTTIRMNAPQGHTDEMRVATRKLIAATEAVAPAVADSITFKRRTLNTVETIWAEDITMTLLEDAIERAGTETRIARLIATGFGNDSDDLFWNGDEAGSGPFITINDGMLKLLQNSQDPDITDLDLTAAGVTTNNEALAALIQAMPDQFLGRTDHVYWAAVTFAQKYAETVSTRETQFGDQVLIQGLPALRYFGIPIIPETHIAGASRRLILTPTTNLFWGVQRVFRMDSEFRPRRRVIEYTLSARTDQEYATGVPVVNGTLVPVAIN